MLHPYQRVLTTLLIVYMLIALGYLSATPPFEASDELWHMGMVHHLSQTGELPVQQIGTETIWEQEGSQPPLYYAIAAVIARTVNSGTIPGTAESDFAQVTQPNPHVVAGNPTYIGNKNLVLHPAQPYPLRGTILSVYLIRVFSICCGVVTLYAVFHVGRTIATPAVGLLAAALTAFNPMLLFISASVNNDNLVIALNSLILWLTVLLLRDGFTARRTVMLAVLIALAALTKLSGLVLLPIVALGALIRVWRGGKSHSGTWRDLFRFGFTIAVAFLVIAAWWYVRNLTLYGELFGTRMMAAVAGARSEPFTVQTLLSEFEGFRIAYWGWFGAVNIITTPLFYWGMDLLTLVSGIGLVIAVIRLRRTPARFELVAVGLLLLTLTLGAGAVIVWTSQTYASQGRLLFPFIAGSSVLMATGLRSVLMTRLLTWIALPALALAAIVIPFTVIAPSYAASTPLPSVPDWANPVYARYEDIELVGYRIEERRYETDESVPVTVIWRVLRPSPHNYSLWLHAVSPTGDVLGKVDGYPDGGRWTTSTWNTGVYVDHYLLPLNENGSGDGSDSGSDKFNLRVQVGWWDYETKRLVSPLDMSGKALESVMLNAGAYAGNPKVILPEAPQVPLEAVFDGVIALRGYTLNTELDELTLYWSARGTPNADYTVFVQVLDEQNNQTTVIGQGDAPPDFPTRYWRSGDEIITRHTIRYEDSRKAGRYKLVIGWYLPTTFARLTLPDGSDSLTLTTITLTE